MGRDTWLKQLCRADNDPSVLKSVLAGGVPDDGLHHAGQAVLRCSASTELIATATLIESLSRRDWSGDPELIAELGHVRDGTTSELVSLAVDLDDIGEALDQSPASVSYLDLANAALWPGELFNVDQGPEDLDADDLDRWLPVVGGGPRGAFAVMECFIATIESTGLASRLQAEINGSGAFRCFQAELGRHSDEYTRWHRFRDDARLGRARAWRADHCYRSTR